MALELNFEQEYGKALTALKKLEQQLLDKATEVDEANTVLAKAESAHRFEAEQLRKDLADAQNELLERSIEVAALHDKTTAPFKTKIDKLQELNRGLGAENKAFKLENNRLIRALQGAADSGKSKASAIAKKALGQA